MTLDIRTILFMAAFMGPLMAFVFLSLRGMLPWLASVLLAALRSRRLVEHNRFDFSGRCRATTLLTLISLVPPPWT